MHSKARCCKCFSPKVLTKAELSHTPGIFCNTVLFFWHHSYLTPTLLWPACLFHRVTCGLSSFRNMWRYLSPLRTRITENHDPQHSLLLLPWVVLKQWIPIAINGSKWLSSLLVWRNDEQDNCRFIFTRTRSQNWHGLMTMASWANSFLPVTSSRILMQGLVH